MSEPDRLLFRVGSWRQRLHQAQPFISDSAAMICLHQSDYSTVPSTDQFQSFLSEASANGRGAIRLLNGPSVEG